MQNIKGKYQASILDSASLEIVGSRLNNDSKLFTLRAAEPCLSKVMISFEHPFAFAKNPVLAEITFQLLKSGTKRLDTFEFVSKLEETGVMLATSVNADSGVVELVFLDKEAENIFPLISEMLNTPRFPEDEFLRLKTAMLQNWHISRRQTQTVAKEHFMHALFSNHPYGTLITEDNITSLKLEDVFQFHKTYIKENNPLLFVASATPGDFVRRFETMFEKLEKVENNTAVDDQNTFPLNFSGNGSSLHFKIDNTVQSSIRMGRPMFTRAHDDFVKAKVATTILGGYFSSRLMANLREDKGYTYGVGAGLPTMAQTGYLTINADVGNQYLDKAILEIKNEITKLQTEKVDDEELNTVKQYLTGSILRELDGAFNRLSLFVVLRRQGLGLDWMNLYVDMMMDISNEDILEFSQKYLLEEDMILVTCG